MNPPDQLDPCELAISLARHSDRLLIPGEGSVAVKSKASPTRMVVSANGLNLEQATAPDFIEFDFAGMTRLLSEEVLPRERIQEARVSGGDLVETLEILTHTCLLGLNGIQVSVHVHPVEVDQIGASPRARQFTDRRTVANEVSQLGPAFLLVPYADPGIPLVRELRKKLLLWNDRYKVPPKIVVVQNHGVFLLGRTGSEVLQSAGALLRAARIFIGASLLGGPVFLTPSNVTHLESIQE